MEISINTVYAARYYFRERNNALCRSISQVLNNSESLEHFNDTYICHEFLKNIHHLHINDPNWPDRPTRFPWWLNALHKITKLENFTPPTSPTRHVDMIEKPASSLIEEATISHLHTATDNDKPTKEVTSAQIYEFACAYLKQIPSAETAYIFISNNNPKTNKNQPFPTIEYQDLFIHTHKYNWVNKPETVDEWLEHLLLTNLTELEKFNA